MSLLSRVFSPRAPVQIRTTSHIANLNQLSKEELRVLEKLIPNSDSRQLILQAINSPNVKNATKLKELLNNSSINKSKNLVLAEIKTILMSSGTSVDVAHIDDLDALIIVFLQPDIPAESKFNPRTASDTSSDYCTRSSRGSSVPGETPPRHPERRITQDQQTSPRRTARGISPIQDQQTPPLRSSRDISPLAGKMLPPDKEEPKKKAQAFLRGLLITSFIEEESEGRTKRVAKPLDETKYDTANSIIAKLLLICYVRNTIPDSDGRKLYIGRIEKEISKLFNSLGLEEHSVNTESLTLQDTRDLTLRTSSSASELLHRTSPIDHSEDGKSRISLADILSLAQNRNEVLGRAAIPKTLEELVIEVLSDQAFNRGERALDSVEITLPLKIKIAEIGMIEKMLKEHNGKLTKISGFKDFFEKIENSYVKNAVDEISLSLTLTTDQPSGHGYAVRPADQMNSPRSVKSPTGPNSIVLITQKPSQSDLDKAKEYIIPRIHRYFGAVSEQQLSTIPESQWKFIYDTYKRKDDDTTVRYIGKTFRHTVTLITAIALAFLEDSRTAAPTNSDINEINQLVSIFNKLANALGLDSKKITYSLQNDILTVNFDPANPSYTISISCSNLSTYPWFKIELLENLPQKKLQETADTALSGFSLLARLKERFSTSKPISRDQEVASLLANFKRDTISAITTELENAASEDSFRMEKILKQTLLDYDRIGKKFDQETTAIINAIMGRIKENGDETQYMDILREALSDANELDRVRMLFLPQQSRSYFSGAGLQTQTHFGLYVLNKEMEYSVTSPDSKNPSTAHLIMTYYAAIPERCTEPPLYNDVTKIKMHQVIEFKFKPTLPVKGEADQSVLVSAKLVSFECEVVNPE